MMTSATTVEYLEFPSLGVYRSKRSERPQSGVTAPPRADATTFEYGEEFTGHFTKLDRIAVTPTLWPEDTERPDGLSLNWARYVLQKLQDDNLHPTKVVASAEGGVAICFVKGNKYADIECLNGGQILGVTSNRRDRPSAWEIMADPGEIARASARIRLFLEGPQTNPNASRRAWGR